MASGDEIPCNSSGSSFHTQSVWNEAHVPIFQPAAYTVPYLLAPAGIGAPVTRKSRYGKKRRDRYHRKQGHGTYQQLPSQPQADLHEGNEALHSAVPCNSVAQQVSAGTIGKRSSLSVQENADGTELFVDGVIYCRPGSHGSSSAQAESEARTHSDDPLINQWLHGETLSRLVKFERGHAGGTPTIAWRGLAEVLDDDGAVALRVAYVDHGSVLYKRSFAGAMPKEKLSRDDPLPVSWLPVQRTYGSRLLEAPLPNRVAEWLEGRPLSPRPAPPQMAPPALTLNWPLQCLAGLITRAITQTASCILFLAVASRLAWRQSLKQ